jgi:DNA-binding NtrC family response regulator
VEVKSGPASAAPQSLKSLVQSVKSEAEKNAIAAALERTGWNRKAAARLLKVSYRTLLYKIEHYHMSAAQPYVVPFMESRLIGLGIAAKRSGKAS